jgi:hypothetical protein
MEVDPTGHSLRELTLIPFKDHSFEGVLHDGFGIELTADYHQFKADKYKAWLRNENEIVVQLPTEDTSFLEQFKSYEDTLTKLQVKTPKMFSDTYEVARMVVRNKILDSAKKDRQVYHILLKFPSSSAMKVGGIELTNAVFTPSRVPYGLIDPQVVPQAVKVVYGPDTGPLTSNNISIRLAWKVTVVEAEPRRAVQAPTSNPSEKTLEDAILSMSI